MTEPPLLVALPGAEAMADALQRALAAGRVTLAQHRFPDGETLVRFEAPVAGRTVVLVAELSRPDDKTLPLLFAADAARDLGAERVLLVAPYLPYMRQDARFAPGEAITSRTYAGLLSSLFDGLVTVDPHLHRHADLGELYRMPARAVSSASAIGAWIREHVPDALVIGPDVESGQWVAAVAAVAGVPWQVLSKTRHGDRDVEVSLPDAQAGRGRRPVLVDDIVSSARTMIEAVRGIRQVGWPAPACIGVHALFAPGAFEALRAAGAERIVTCDTVPHPSNGIAVAGSIAAALGTLAATPR